MVIEHPVLIDTGPIVAYLNRDDAEHESCSKVFHALPLGKAFTC
jgi:predicted nucleic acid-binding protein